MIIGPVFTRELVTAPRRLRFYVGRAVYVAVLLTLVCTAWLLLTGTQEVRSVGDMARFGATMFQLLAPLQLALVLFFSALLTGSAVAQEKDRRTLILLLMTRLSNSELVLGKLLSSLLQPLCLLAAAWPLFMLIALFGGISVSQIAWVFAVTVATALAAGSIGSTLALWREKTFQTLALAFLVLMVWLAAGEVLVALGNSGIAWNGASLTRWGEAISPWRAVLIAARPEIGQLALVGRFGSPVHWFLGFAALIVVVANGVAMLRVRVWNPSREVQRQTADEDVFQTAGESTPVSPHAAPQATRPVWDNPVIWREIRTWAYGRKVLVIRLAYLFLAAVAALGLHAAVATELPDRGTISLALAPIIVLSLILVNALAVTSITTERDLGALDLLLVTDLTPAEFLFGKLGGVFYVAKEMILVPLAMCIYLWLARATSLENTLYLLLAIAIGFAFVATLGIHAGLTYVNSRSAVAVSLGMVFFLFVGIATCMRIMMSFGGSFELQLAPFLVFMVGGGIGMFVALGHRNPSAAIALASIACPTLTFVAITSFLQQETLGVFLVLVGAYGFTTVAMLVPAVYEFDVETGRSTSAEE